MSFIQNKIQPLKTCNIAYNYQSSTIAEVNLPTSEPETAQVSYTVTSGMFPTLTGNLPASIDYVGFLLAGCLNASATTARTLNWRVKRNGVSIGTGSQSISASNKGTLNFDSLSGTNKPVAGDVLEIYLWCTESATEMQVNRHGLGIIPTRFKPVNNINRLVMNFAATVTHPVVANFNENTNDNNAVLYKYISGSGTSYISQIGTFASYTLLDGEHATYGMLSSKLDTAPHNNVRTHATAYYFDAIYLPTVVSWQETNIMYGGNLR